MITIHTSRLEFKVEHEAFACNLYGRWEGFSRMSVEKVIEDVLTPYDRPDEVIRLEKVVVDLGTVAEAEFYDRFPRLLAEKLTEIFRDCLRYQSKYQIEVISLRKDRLEMLLFFLFHGYFPFLVSADIRPLSLLFRKVMLENGEALVRLLRKNADSLVLRERLVLQFGNEELELLTGVAEPSEATFINLYVRYLMTTHRRLEHAEITADHYRNVVWSVVLAYLLFEDRSFFSRKQMVIRTIRQLSTHFNLDFQYLLQLLLSGLEKFTKEWIFVPELLAILSDIRLETTGPITGQNAEATAKFAFSSRNFTKMEEPESAAIDWKKLLEKMQQAPLTAFRREHWVYILSHPLRTRQLLAGWGEEKICRLTQVVIPEESDFVVSYAFVLESEKEKQMLEGKAGQEFRLLKWEFIFLVILSAPASAFSRKQFVRGVLEHLAAHYNLTLNDLLDYFYRVTQRETRALPESIRRVLEELWEEKVWAKSVESSKTDPERELLPGKKTFPLAPAGEEKMKIQKPAVKPALPTFRETEWKTEKGLEEKKIDSWILKMKKEEAEFWYIGNAGLVLLAPYLPQLFIRLGWIEKKCFRNDEARIKGVFLLQYLVTAAEKQVEEPELMLNKLLVDYQIEEPLPLQVNLTEEEKEMVGSLIRAVMQNWKVMQNTSEKAFRESFLIRPGKLEKKERVWHLTVEEKPYDLLLSTLPWSFSPIKFSWMEEMIYVHWR